MSIETITKAVAETTKEIKKDEAKKKSEIVKMLDKPLNISEVKEIALKDISSKDELKVLDRPLNSRENMKQEISKEIKPEVQESTDDAKSFWDDMLDGENDEPSGLSEDDNFEKDLEKTSEEYFDDLKEKSECPETIPDKPFEPSDLKKISPEENAEMRDEFDDKKAQLKREWEEANGRSWPKYDHDVYSKSGKRIREAGSDYDAHHIQPLGMGGKNVASNITPLNAEVHYDKQGVHAMDSPYSKLDQMLGGMG